MRDDTELRAGFERWWTDRSRGLSDVAVELSRPKAGLSSETLFFEGHARASDGSDASESLVIRVPPTGSPIFPDYSLERLARTLNAVAATGVPVPAPATLIEDEQWIGSPFLAMPRVEGRVLPTSPAYCSAGWLHDASNEQRTRLITGFAEVLARIHRIDAERLDLPPLSGGGPDLTAAVAWWRAYFDWLGADEMPGAYRLGLDWCEANVPNAPPSSLLWGDVQLVNAVFDDDFGVAAILDWEMASLGAAEIDVAWFLTLHEMTVTLAPADTRATFPDRAEILAVYEHALGRSLDDLRWYEVFAQLRSGAIVMRLALQAGPAGKTWMAASPQRARIRQLIAGAP
jgi:aminoglycoside phosphotransferase (APT) family kinase protein